MKKCSVHANYDETINPTCPVCDYDKTRNPLPSWEDKFEDQWVTGELASELGGNISRRKVRAFITAEINAAEERGRQEAKDKILALPGVPCMDFARRRTGVHIDREDFLASLHQAKDNHE